MSEKKKQRFTHRHIDKFMKIMGILYACHVLWQIAACFFVRAHVPDHKFDGMRYVLTFFVYAGLYIAWRKHFLFVACGLGAILSILVAYHCVDVGLGAIRPFWKWTNFMTAPAALGIFGWMFVWYPLKLIRKLT